MTGPAFTRCQLACSTHGVRGNPVAREALSGRCTAPADASAQFLAATTRNPAPLPAPPADKGGSRTVQQFWAGAMKNGT